MATLKLNEKELKKLSARGGMTEAECQAAVQQFIDHILSLLASIGQCENSDGGISNGDYEVPNDTTAEDMIGDSLLNDIDV